MTSPTLQPDLLEAVARLIEAHIASICSDGNADPRRVSGPLSKAVLALVSSTGWRHVPVEPTAEMLESPWMMDTPGVPEGYGCLATWLEDTADDEAMAAIYRAMIAAAPPFNKEG